MPAEVSLTVTPDLQDVTARLKQYAEGGGKELKKQLAKEMRGLGDKIVRAEQESARRTKVRGVAGSGDNSRVRYKRGGSAAGSGKGIRGPVANSIMRRNRLSGREVGVEVRASKGKMPPGLEKMPWNLNRGGWKHPVFGDRSTWAAQVVTPAGFFWRARDEMKPVVQREIRSLAEKYMKEALKLGA